MQYIAKLALMLVALALTGCGTPDRSAASGDIAQATANPAYPTPPASVEPQATAELTATAALTPTAELAAMVEPTPTSLPLPTAELMPTEVTPAHVVGTPPDPLATVWTTGGSAGCQVPHAWGSTDEEGWVEMDYGPSLLYIDPAGTVYDDPRPFLKVIERPGQPPLLITCPLSDTLAVIDPLTDRRIDLDLPASTHIDELALSPDGRLLALRVYSHDRANPVDLAPLQLLDLETGIRRPLVDKERLKFSPDGYGSRLMGWAGGKLYLHQQDSGTAIFWEVDPADPSPQPRNILVLGHSGGWTLLPQNQALISNYISQPPTWLDLQTEQRFPFTASIGLESPDGTTIALIRDTLMFYDVRSQQFRPAVPPFQPRIFTSWISSESGWWWRADGQEMLIVQQRGDEDFLNAVIVDRGGAVRATVPLGNPTGELIGIPKLSNNGDLLLFTHANGNIVLRRIDTHATPFGMRDLALPHAGDIVYVPAP